MTLRLALLIVAVFLFVCVAFSFGPAWFLAAGLAFFAASFFPDFPKRS